MSATTAPHKVRLHHHIVRHARSRTGLFVIGAAVFVTAWLVWNFWLAAV